MTSSMLPWLVMLGYGLLVWWMAPRSTTTAGFFDGGSDGGPRPRPVAADCQCGDLLDFRKIHRQLGGPRLCPSGLQVPSVMRFIISAF
jgi:hypothetical protein